MSGFVNPNQGQGLRFVQTIGGLFRMASTPEEIEKYSSIPGVIKIRENKKGVEVTETCSSLIKGHLIEVGEREVPYSPGKENYVTIQDDEGAKFRVNLSHQGRGILYVMKRLPNIREDLPIEFGIFEIEDKNAKGETIQRAQIYIRQVNEEGTVVKVEDAFPFDKENPDSSPLPAFRKFEGKGGKTEWDPTPQYQWLLDNCALEYAGRISKMTPLVPKEPEPEPQIVHGRTSSGEGVEVKIPAPKQEAPAKKPKAPETSSAPIESQYDDDLPF